MAIYHFSVSVGSRSKGQSARAKYNYIAAEGKYRKKDAEVVSVWSANMPSWAGGGREFWYQADRLERANACLYRQLQISLPQELDAEQNRQLLEAYLAEALEGQPYTVALHDKGDGNPHAHVVFSERQLDGYDRPPEQFFHRADPSDPARGGAKKNAALKKKDWLLEQRQAWETHMNAALEMAGIEERVSCASLEAQGIDRAPKHISRRALALEEKGVRTWQKQAQEERAEQYRRRTELPAALEEEKRRLEEEDRRLHQTPKEAGRVLYAAAQEIVQKAQAAEMEAAKQEMEKAIERRKLVAAQKPLLFGVSAWEERYAAAKEAEEEAARKLRRLPERHSQEQRIAPEDRRKLEAEHETEYQILAEWTEQKREQEAERRLSAQ